MVRRTETNGGKRKVLVDLFGQAVFTVQPYLLETWYQRGLSLPQLRLLYVLRDASPVTAGELAQRLGVTPSTLTGLLDRLEREGYVERTRHATDRRQMIPALTDSGRHVIAELDQAAQDYFQRVVKALGERQAKPVEEAFQVWQQALETAR